MDKFLFGIFYIGKMNGWIECVIISCIVFAEIKKINILL